MELDQSNRRVMKAIIKFQNLYQVMRESLKGIALLKGNPQIP